MSPDGILAATLETLRALGVEGEVYLEQARRTTVSVRGGEVERLEERHDRGVAVRAFRDRRVGFAFTTAVDLDALRTTAGQAAEIARWTAQDEAWRLPEAERVEPLPFPSTDAALATFPAQARIELATRLERAALDVDPRVRTPREAVVRDAAGEVWIASTRGIETSFASTNAVAHVEAVVEEDGRSHGGFQAGFALGPSTLDVETIGREAAARALRKLGATRPATGRVPAVLDREVVAAILEAISPAFSGRMVVQGTSFVAPRMGEQVAPATVTLVDDPRLPGGAGSTPIDGEGLPTARTPLIEHGRVAGLLHSTWSAIRLGAARGGNALRPSYAMPPRIGTMNLLLQPGGDGLDSLLACTGSGVLIHEVMGLHTIDPVTGDFSLGASGQLVEGGETTTAIDGFAISGSILELLASIEAVGSDLRLVPEGGGAPSVLVREISVAGS